MAVSWSRRLANQARALAVMGRIDHQDQPAFRRVHDQMNPVATSVSAAGVTVAAFSKSAQLPFSPWLFLPQLAQRFVVMPVDALSRYLATLDDKAVDAVVRAGARFALWLASLVAL